MSDGKPKRRFWQLHLSTAVFILVSLSLFGWLNLREHYGRIGPPGEGDGDSRMIVRGWPRGFEEWAPNSSRTIFSTGDLLTNLGLGVGSIALIGCCFEYNRRRREGRKP